MNRQKLPFAKNQFEECNMFIATSVFNDSEVL